MHLLCQQLDYHLYQKHNLLLKSQYHFQIKLHTGTGSEQAITLDGDTDMQPDLVWIKNRTIFTLFFYVL